MLAVLILTPGFCLLTPSLSPAQVVVNGPGLVTINGKVTLGNQPAAIATLSASSLGFATQAEGTTSAPLAVTLTNTGAVTLSSIALSITGSNAADFAQTTSPATNCGGSLTSGSVCTISVAFTPATGAGEMGTLSIADNAGNTPQTVSLSGTGQAGGGGTDILAGAGNFNSPNNCTSCAPWNTTHTYSNTADLSVTTGAATTLAGGWTGASPFGLYALDINYPSGSIDINRYLSYYADQLDTYLEEWVQYYAYFPASSAGLCGQRKTLYLKTGDNNNLGGGSSYNGFAVMTGDMFTSNKVGGVWNIKGRSDAGSYALVQGGGADDYANATRMYPGNTYRITYHARLNTITAGVANSDGLVELYINGTKQFSHTNFKLLGNQTLQDYWKWTEVGVQFDPWTCDGTAQINTSTEHRFIGNIAIYWGSAGPAVL